MDAELRLVKRVPPMNSYLMSMLVTSTAEPSALLLLATGLIGLAVLLKRKLSTGANRSR